MMRVVFEDWQEDPRQKIKEASLPAQRNYMRTKMVGVWREESTVEKDAPEKLDLFRIIQPVIYAVLSFIFIPFAIVLLQSSLSFLSPALFLASIGFAMSSVGKIVEHKEKRRVR